MPEKKLNKLIMQYDYDLSVIIPANNEEFLSGTIQNILKQKRGRTEIIAVLDGGVWANPVIEKHPDVQVIYVPDTIGQRGATKLGIQLSKARFVMKLDAHCIWDEGYDVKMMEAFEKTGDNVVMVGIMRNLHVYDWKCPKCGKKEYQDRENICPIDGTTMKKKMLWEPRKGTYSQSYAFDSQPHFSYFSEYKQRPEYIKGKEEGLTESMSLQGSCWMATREKYWELQLTDPSFGSWGSEGIEVACKMWLSGGRVLVNHSTWYAHCFRTKPHFSFPYEQSGRGVDKTKARVWEHFFNGRFKQQIHPVSWLIEKFWPLSPGTPDDKRNNLGWTPEALALLKEKELGLKLKELV